MKISRIACLLTFALGLGLLGTGCSRSDVGAPASRTPSGTAPGTTANMAAPAIQYDFYTPTSEDSLKTDTNYGYLIAKTSPTFREGLFTAQGLKVIGKISNKGFNYYHLYRESGVLEAMEDLKRTSGVLFVEPDLLLTHNAGFAYDNPDPRTLSEEYSVYITKCKEAWETYGFGPHRPTTADIDTGINFSHEDLKGVVTHAFSWYDLANGGALIDGTADHSVQPIDYVGSTTVFSTDGNGHGSHTGGTIAAVGNNGKGVAGVCWNTDLVSYKGLADSGSGGSWAIYGSLYHLINWKKANYDHTIAVNMSLGGAAASQFAIDMVEACVENNVVIVASMGNTGQNMAQYPAGYQGVIAVGATTGADKKVHFSTSGRNISVTAPGYNVISTYNGAEDDYASESGTSMSTPFVTGLVTYMLTFAPDLNAAQIKTYLESNTDLIEGATGFTETNGWGRVNVLKTIGAVVADVNANKTASANYVNARLKVAVSNTFQGGTTAFTGVPVYLYNCNEAGTITNYVASSITVADSVTKEVGVAFFNLLKPGYYVARSSYGGNPASTPVFQVKAGDTSIPAQTIPYTLPVYWIQTFMDAGSTGAEDDIITVWNQAGSKIATVDVGNLDNAGLVLTPQTYKFSVTPFNASSIGEYALYVSPTFYPAATAPGTFAAPDATALLGSQSHATATPQTILLNQLYNCKMPTTGDFYSVVIP